MEREQATFRRDDDDTLFVLDQHLSTGPTRFAGFI